MRVAAILFIVLSTGANFFFGNLQSFLLASFSYPVLVWLLVGKKKRKAAVNEKAAAPEQPVQ